MAHRKYHVHHHRHHGRRNPFGVTGEAVSDVGWGLVGFVGARAIPAMALPSRNTGVIGYVMNAGVAILARFLVGGPVGERLLVGGLIGTGARIVSDQLGTRIQGLSGDPAFTLGAYWSSYFAVPTVSDPYGRVASSPYPAPPLPAGPAGMSGYAGAAGARAVSTGRFTAGRFG